MAGPAARWAIDAHVRDELRDGWRVARLDDGEPGPWRDARVPGTVAAALGELDNDELDGHDWLFATELDLAPAADDEELVLRLDGVATRFDVELDGERRGGGTSMFAATELPIAAGARSLAIRCQALAPLLATPRKPRARWRQRVVDGGLRFERTMLLGRAPGFAPSPAAVGPWRPVAVERRRALVLDGGGAHARLDGDTGRLTIAVAARPLGTASIAGAHARLHGPTGVHESALDVTEGQLRGELVVDGAARWWPHTHGDPARYRLTLTVSLDDGRTVEVDAGAYGFRTLAFDADEGLRVNGVPIFARGALWTPLSLACPHAEPDALDPALRQACGAGMNMLRIPGTAIYESAAFHDGCDELGIVVWQDMMFANLDYPIDEPEFRATVAHELAEQLGALAGHPSLVVVCGNSEVEQQVAMVGLDPALGRGELFGELLPAAVADAGLDAAYVPSSPCGDGLPFRPGSGIAHYFGVGGYRRPLEDARRAAVGFASECLAFSNVSDHAPPDSGVPGDVGADWDFADVRDHYLELLYGVDAGSLRAAEPARYAELARQATGDAIAETIGEWRRDASGCHGALILWLRDVLDGAGWGLIDARGRAKVAYHRARRVMAPVAVWTTDEGLGGIAIHIANDRPEPLHATLRLALYADDRAVDGGEQALELAAHGNVTRDAEALLGHFADLSWAYRFGPPQQNVIVASLEHDGALLAQAMRFPAGPPVTPRSADELGLTVSLDTPPGAAPVVRVGARHVLWGVRLSADGWRAADDAFDVEPGHERAIALHRHDGDPSPLPPLTVRALNLDRPTTIEWPGPLLPSLDPALP